MSADERAGVRYARDVTPDDVGVRVSLRRRLADGSQPETYSDVLGVLESWSEGVLRVRRRDDVVVEIAQADVVAVKQVPPAPERRPR